MEDKKKKYANYWLDIVFIFILYISIVFAIYFAKISLFGWLLPLILVFWKIFSYQIVFPKALKGIRFYREEGYEEAISMFKDCLEKIERYKALDDFKAILLFSSLKISFKSIFYSHIINSYVKLGNEDEAKKCFFKFKDEEPYSIVMKMKAEELGIEIPDCNPLSSDNNENEENEDPLNKPKVALDIVQIVIFLFLLYMLIINSAGPLGLSVSALILICIYVFWKFGMFALTFPEAIKARTADLDHQIILYKKCLERIEKKNYLDRFRAVLFLNVNKVSYKEIFEFKIKDLSCKKQVK